MSDGYDLTDLKAPRTAGLMLKGLVRLAEGPGGDLLAAKFLADVGVEALRAAKVEDGPAAEHPLLRRARQEGCGAVEKLVQLPAPATHPDDWPFETAGDFVDAYSRGATTPSEVAERLLRVVAELDEGKTPLRALINRDPDDLRTQARAATARYAAGRPLGPLDGVPVGVKDELDQAGYPTTVGTRFLGTRPALEDATVVARLRSAGALLYGKLNMHEIGLGVTGLNPHHGPARNPYDPTRATGGSSSGVAASVAAGLNPIAVGADGGGSIRIPASLCGVVGLKATFGRISEHGAAPLCWSVAHVGPLAQDVRDCALAYAVMAGPDRHDVNSTAQPPVDLTAWDDRDLTGVRLGVYRPFFEHADAPIVTACDAALQDLRRRGAAIVEIRIPELALARVAHMVTITSEMVASQAQHYAKHRREYGHDVRLNLALASRLTQADYIQAQRVRVRIQRHLDEALSRCDAIVTPSTARTAPELPADALVTGESNLEDTDRIMRFAAVGNLTGLPAISVPAGFDDQGLPIGIQFMGRAWSESLLLRLAGAVEAGVGRPAPRVHRRLLT